MARSGKLVLSWICGAVWLWAGFRMVREGGGLGRDRNFGVGGALMPVMGSRAFVSLGVVVAVMGVCASPAWGAFPGRDGDLAVATNGGLKLVAPGTGATRSICTSVVLCGHPAQPSFSPNGRAIAFVDTTSHRPVVVAADGSCLWCLLGAPLTGVHGSEPAFTADRRGVTVAGDGVWQVSLTGGAARHLVTGPVAGAVWSSRGSVAVVRAGWVWVGRPGHGRLRRLARGRSPSFSPDGASLALARGGYVWIVRVADGSKRRLVRGAAPAWSPSGRRIAYIAGRGAVEIVAAQGGRPRRLGSVRGTALDWQPVASSTRPACQLPSGSTVLASNRDAVVFSHGYNFSYNWYGCLNALGQTRVLLDLTQETRGVVPIAIRFAGRFALLEPEYSDQYGDYTEKATLHDLSSGKKTDLASVSWLGPPTNPSGQPILGLDFLALDSSGFAAWRQTTRPMLQPMNTLSCPSVSLCVAGDGAGNILSSTNPAGGPTAWSLTSVLSNESFSSAISCPSISLCVAVGFAGDVLTSIDPTGGASAWTKTHAVPGTYLYAVSCPSVSLCVAGGVEPSGIHGEASILTSTNPTGGASSWSSAPIASGGGIVDAVSCPSVSLCVAGGPGGNILFTTNPTGGASAWNKAKVGSLNVISCPSVSVCVAGDGGGNIVSTTNPTGGAGAWKETTVDQGQEFTAVSCPSVSLCVAGDGGGNILTSTHPTGGASAWRKAYIAHPPGTSGTQISHISCPSVSLCVAADEGGNILTSTDPTGGAKAWTSATVDVPGCAPPLIPCMSEQLYARDDQGTRVLDTTPPGRSNSISNVALDGDSLILTWTHDGARRQLKLH